MKNPDNYGKISPAVYEILMDSSTHKSLYKSNRMPDCLCVCSLKARQPLDIHGSLTVNLFLGQGRFVISFGVWYLKPPKVNLSLKKYPPPHKKNVKTKTKMKSVE